MDINEFTGILLDEMREHKEIANYYKFFGDPKLFEFRKSYFTQRLKYTYNKLIEQMKQAKKPLKIWDCGCGFGTTGFFLAMNGIKSHGSTIGEHYEREIPKRKEFWSRYGDTSLFTVSYDYLPDNAPPPNSYDAIIIQDTLHHLEPLNEVLDVLYNSLKPDGKLIITEPNGNNLYHKITLFLRRGNRRIGEIYDERLQKTILYGDENFKNIGTWKKVLKKQNLLIDSKVEYIRLFMPFFYSEENVEKIISIEQKLYRKNPLLREFFFFGMNFTVSKA